MTRRLAALAGLLAAVTAASPLWAAPARFNLDPEHLTVAFMVRHIGYADVLAQFLRAQGSFVFDESARTVSDLNVTIDPASVFSNHKERDDHIRKPDFLDVAEYPTIMFVGTHAQATGADTGKITGDLTVRGVTRPVTLDVKLNKTGVYPYIDNYVVGVSVRTTIKRSEFGMTYGIENGLVGDEVDILIELEAIREKS